MASWFHTCHEAGTAVNTYEAYRYIALLRASRASSGNGRRYPGRSNVLRGARLTAHQTEGRRVRRASAFPHLEPFRKIQPACGRKSKKPPRCSLPSCCVAPLQPKPRAFPSPTGAEDLPLDNSSSLLYQKASKEYCYTGLVTALPRL